MAGGDRRDAAVGPMRTRNVPAHSRGEAQGVRWAAVAPRPAFCPDGARVEGGLRAPGSAAAVAARGRRCVRIGSITDARVMNATIRIVP